jgi:hypothetical protein
VNVRDAVRLGAIGVCFGFAAACTDPGCIRNSECQTNYRCLEASCVRAGGDAGMTSAPNEPNTPSKPNTPSEPNTPADAGSADEDAGSE